MQTLAEQLGQELSQRVTADTLTAGVAQIRAEITSAQVVLELREGTHCSVVSEEIVFFLERPR